MSEHAFDLPFPTGLTGLTLMLFLVGVGLLVNHWVEESR